MGIVSTVDCAALKTRGFKALAFLVRRRQHCIAEPTTTATKKAYLAGRVGLAAPLMGPEFAPPVVPLAQPVPTTHRVISYTYPLTLLRTGDAVVNRTAMTTTSSV